MTTISTASFSLAAFWPSTSHYLAWISSLHGCRLLCSTLQVRRDRFQGKRAPRDAPDTQSSKPPSITPLQNTPKRDLEPRKQEVVGAGRKPRVAQERSGAVTSGGECELMRTDFD